jgi:uncharacterized protein
MITSQDIQKIKKIAQSYFVEISGCHDWTHIERVLLAMRKINQIEKGDGSILEAAVYLHDIGRKEELKNEEEKTGKKIDHAIAGAKIAQKILADFNFTAEEKENIIHCIQTHRWRNKNIPQTLEAKILFDADKLDSLGAIGIARIFLFAGNVGSKCLYAGREKELAQTGIDYSFTCEDSAVLEYESKLKKIQNRMITKTGRKLAKERSKFMDDFFEQFQAEINGIK